MQRVHSSLGGMVVLIAVAMLGACSDSDRGATDEVADPASAAYCDLVRESVEIQIEVGPDGPTPEQNQQMARLAVRLRDEAPPSLQDAYEASDQLSEDASAAERIAAFRAYNEALDEWTKANCT